MPKEKKYDVILVNYPEYNQKPFRIKVDSWTEKQTADFLNAIKTYTASDYRDPCAFNVHFDKHIIHSCMFNAPMVFQPRRTQNKKSEIIIEIIPSKDSDCWASCNNACPVCLRNGDCTSPFIREYIGKILFDHKYQKQR